MYIEFIQIDQGIFPFVEYSQLKIKRIGKSELCVKFDFILEGLFDLPPFFVRKRVAFISDSYSLRMEQVAKADETEKGVIRWRSKWRSGAITPASRGPR